MTLDSIPISDFLGVVIEYLIPVLLLASGGTVAFTIVRKGCRWARRML
jgi:hypothetical protein